MAQPASREAYSAQLPRTASELLRRGELLAQGITTITIGLAEVESTG